MSQISIDSRVVGSGSRPYIIAEAGINHNGELEKAKEMIIAAKKAGVDAVKFQTFYAKDFVQDKNLLYTYKSQGAEITEPIWDVFERVEFSREEWCGIKEFCDSNSITFLSTPGNVSDLELLMSMGVKAVKVGSDDFVNIPLIRRYAEENVPLLLSCGMATEDEIDLTLKAAGIKAGKEICLFHCTSQYPTPASDVNMLKLQSLKKKYPNLVLGLSDHTRGNTAAIMAVASGAVVFEKHFTLCHDLKGPDHWFSEEPEELKSWVDAIHEAYEMLGAADICPTDTEMGNREEYHRSITTVRDIKAGEYFSEDNLCMRRPGSGLPASMWDDIIGKKAAKDIEENSQISVNDFI